ncbi:hypothetical protein FQN57_001526 [Myotisia sp. PD_48]|nr:hypothetical protein FQN57_001526 [Myotisia sp. PD_48]
MATDVPVSLRRSSTLPARVAQRSRHSLPPSNLYPHGKLYNHPFVKIVKFELPSSAPSVSHSQSILPDLDYPVDAIETLPWKVSAERTVALGPLTIEKVSGSTSFLKSGDIVQALLRNCQCWCVDGKSTFVLRIRKLTYYRIELPNTSEDDLRRVEELKGVLSSIIRYEITPCPFKREFSVEIPEEAKTPKKKKAWRPKRDSISALPPAYLLAAGHPLEDSGSSDGADSKSDIDIEIKKIRKADPSIDSLEQEEGKYRRSTSSSMRSFTEPAQTLHSLIGKFQDVSVSELGDRKTPLVADDSDAVSSNSNSFQTSENHKNTKLTDQLLVEISDLESLSDSESSSHLPVAFNLEPIHESSHESTLKNDEASIIFAPNNIDDSNSSTHVAPLEFPNNSTSVLSPNHLNSSNIVPRLDHSNSSKSVVPINTLNNSTGEVPLDHHSTRDDTSVFSPDETDDNTSAEFIACEANSVRDQHSTIRNRLRERRRRGLSPSPPASTLYHPLPQSPTDRFVKTVLQMTCIYVFVLPIKALAGILRLVSTIASGDETITRYITYDQPSYRNSLAEDNFGLTLSPSLSSNQDPHSSNHSETYDSFDDCD